MLIANVSVLTGAGVNGFSALFSPPVLFHLLLAFPPRWKFSICNAIAWLCVRKLALEKSRRSGLKDAFRFAKPPSK